MCVGKFFSNKENGKKDDSFHQYHPALEFCKQHSDKNVVKSTVKQLQKRKRQIIVIMQGFQAEDQEGSHFAAA